MSLNLSDEFWEEYFAPWTTDSVAVRIDFNDLRNRCIAKEIQPTVDDMVNTLCEKIEAIRDPVLLE